MICTFPVLIPASPYHTPSPIYGNPIPSSFSLLKQVYRARPEMQVSPGLPSLPCPLTGALAPRVAAE